MRKRKKDILEALIKRGWRIRSKDRKKEKWVKKQRLIILDIYMTFYKQKNYLQFWISSSKKSI